MMFETNAPGACPPGDPTNPQTASGANLDNSPILIKGIPFPQRAGSPLRFCPYCAFALPAFAGICQCGGCGSPVNTFTAPTRFPKAK
jgi:hypothetical protein